MKEEEVAKLGELANLSDEWGPPVFFSAVLRSLLDSCVVGANAGARRYRAVRSRVPCMTVFRSSAAGTSRVLTPPIGCDAGVGQDVDIFAGGPVACLADFGLILGSVGGVPLLYCQACNSQCVFQYPW